MSRKNIKTGEIIVATDVIDALSTSLYNLSCTGIRPYSAIFDANNSPAPHPNERSASFSPASRADNDLWQNITLPRKSTIGDNEKDYCWLSQHFLSNMYTKIYDELDHLREHYNVSAGLPTALSGFRNTILSCYAYASNVRDTVIDYYDKFKYAPHTKLLSKRNNMFLQSHAIESKGVANRVFSNREKHMFYNKTQVDGAAVGYDTVPVYVNKFYGYNMKVINDTKYTLLSNTNRDGTFRNHGIFAPFPFTHESTSLCLNNSNTLLYTNKIMYASDVLNCINFMDDLTEYIKTHLTCYFGKFTDCVVHVVYHPFNGSINRKIQPNYNGSVTGSNSAISVELPMDDFRLYTPNELLNASLVGETQKDYFRKNIEILGDMFLGWTTDVNMLKTGNTANLASYCSKDNITTNNFNLRTAGGIWTAFRNSLKPLDGATDYNSGEWKLDIYPVYGGGAIINCYFGYCGYHTSGSSYYHKLNCTLNIKNYDGRRIVQCSDGTPSGLGALIPFDTNLRTHLNSYTGTGVVNYVGGYLSRIGSRHGMTAYFNGHGIVSYSATGTYSGTGSGRYYGSSLMGDAGNLRSVSGGAALNPEDSVAAVHVNAYTITFNNGVANFEIGFGGSGFSSGSAGSDRWLRNTEANINGGGGIFGYTRVGTTLNGKTKNYHQYYPVKRIGNYAVGEGSAFAENVSITFIDFYSYSYAN